MARRRVRESMLGGLALILVGVLCLVLQRWLAPRPASATQWYLWVMVGVGLFHMLEGFFGLGLPNLRVVRRAVRAWRIRHCARPDALAEPRRQPPEWARPLACRCGEFRPETAPRCPGCGRI